MALLLSLPGESEAEGSRERGTVPEHRMQASLAASDSPGVGLKCPSPAGDGLSAHGCI